MDRRGTGALVTVLAGVGAIVLILVLAAILLALSQPNVPPTHGTDFRLTDVSITCGTWWGNDQNRTTFAFRLLNLGDEGGAATVRFTVTQGNVTLLNTTKVYGLLADTERTYSESFLVPCGEGYVATVSLEE